MTPEVIGLIQFVIGFVIGCILAGFGFILWLFLRD